MYKIIACDLDETLISSDLTISKENVEAIKKATAKGVKFVVATGRGFYALDSILEELGLNDLEDQYVISYNGGAITENKNKRLLFMKGLDFEDANNLFKRGKELGICQHVYVQGKTYLVDPSDDENSFISSRLPVELTDQKDLEFVRGKTIIKVIYMTTDKKYLYRLKDLVSDLTENVDVSFSSSRYIEFNAKGVNKGNGLIKLAELLNVDIKDTIAIGDNYNDLSMIKAAGLGVGVANAVEGIKKDCDYITKNDNNHHAIKEVIDKFILKATE